MKKIKYLMLGALLFGALSMGACKKKDSGGGNEPGGGGTEPGGGGTEPGGGGEPSKSTVTVYLSLGEIGLYEGKKGTDYPEVFVENGIKLVEKPGTALPGADKITSTSGATFVSWMVYEGDGAPKAYTTVPEYDTVLYANWTGGSGTEPGGGGTEPGGDPVDPEGQITYTLTNSKGWDVFVDGAKVYSWVWGGSHDTGEWIVCTKVDETSLSFTCDSSATGCKIVRFSSSVSTPDWDAEKWNESGDITLDGSTTTVSYSIGS